MPGQSPTPVRLRDSKPRRVRVQCAQRRGGDAMRKATTTLVLTTALLGWTTTPAAAQDSTKPAASSADAADEAFLKAYFAEKELKDYAAAEKQYAALAGSAFAQASREVVARATLGRARCLVALKRADEAAPLFAK